ncbi:hypothetical protein ACWEGE_01170 [Amycolatopsis sp. NPDC004747]
MIEPAWIAGGAAVVSSCAAIWSATNGNRTLKRSDRDSQARTRPMVAAELREVPYVRGTQILVIKNYGPAVARDVVVTFDPPLPDPLPDAAHKSLGVFLKARYEKPVPTLVPGMELDNIYFDGIDDHDGGWKNNDPFPDAFTVTISSTAPDGERYTDRFALDVGLIRNRTFATSSRHPEERLTQAVKHLDAISKSLASLARSGGIGNKQIQEQVAHLARISESLSIDE